MSREEWLQATQRTYGTTQENVIKATEKIFRLADGDDFKVAHHENGLTATRPWIVYMVFTGATGTDYWSLNVKDNNGKTKASIAVSTDGNAVAPIATTSPGVYSAGSAAIAGTPVNGTALYDLFWSRMDWMLGLRKDWMGCKEADAMVKEKKVWGTNEALCNSFNIKDTLPTEEERVIQFSTNN